MDELGMRRSMPASEYFTEVYKLFDTWEAPGAQLVATPVGFASAEAVVRQLMYGSTGGRSLLRSDSRRFTTCHLMHDCGSLALPRV